MAEDDEPGEHRLHVGDYVFLHSLKTDTATNTSVSQGYLSAEGIIDENAFVDTREREISNHLFCIHTQKLYSAHKELLEFNELRKKDSLEESKDPGMMKYRQVLERGARSEKGMNDDMLQRKIGTPINFGDTIQLLHVKSEKYLTIIDNQLAEDERENLKVVLSSSGSSLSWLRFMPRFKIDKKGDPILSLQEICIEVVDRNSEYVHASSKDLRSGAMREVNCSLELSWWRINRYQVFEDTEDENNILACQLVVLKDPETLSSLQIHTVEREEYEDDGIAGAIAKAHDLDRVVLEPDELIFNSNALWMIERKGLEKEVH